MERATKKLEIMVKNMWNTPINEVRGFENLPESSLEAMLKREESKHKWIMTKLQQMDWYVFKKHMGQFNCPICFETHTGIDMILNDMKCNDIRLVSSVALLDGTLLHAIHPEDKKRIKFTIEK